MSVVDYHPFGNPSTDSSVCDDLDDFSSVDSLSTTSSGSDDSTPTRGASPRLTQQQQQDLLAFRAFVTNVTQDIPDAHGPNQDRQENPTKRAEVPATEREMSDMIRQHSTALDKVKDFTKSIVVGGGRVVFKLISKLFGAVGTGFAEFRILMTKAWRAMAWSCDRQLQAAEQKLQRLRQGYNVTCNLLQDALQEYEDDPCRSTMLAVKSARDNRAKARKYKREAEAEYVRCLERVSRA